MSLSAENKTCGICTAGEPMGQGKAIFTAECSHSFHFNCITTYAGNGNNLCPICHVKWDVLPFLTPSFNPNYTRINNRINNRFQFSHFPAPQMPPSPFPQYSFPHYPTFEAEPIHFSDDEILPAPSTANDNANATSSICLQIKAIPERPALAASDFVSQFPVLVGLKAPSLSNDLDRAPIDLVTVLDVSGSMSGSKLDLVKRAVCFVIDNLGPSDRLSIVSFSTNAHRILRLRRMTENGRVVAKQAVNSLFANGGTNIVEGLKKGVRVLEERRGMNTVSSIIFLSDGNDTCNHGPISHFSRQVKAPQYLHLLPASICPKNRTMSDGLIEQQTFPVHSFGFGTDHDPIAMHAIADASGGTFSFIESFEMVQDAFANCIGGLLSVVIQELRLTVRAASHGVEIKSIPSGRYASEISNKGSEGVINVGDMYAEEDREFLINLSVPVLQSEGDQKTSLLDITCSYKDVVSKDIVQVEADLVEIRRPESLSPLDMVTNLEVDRQRNRLFVADSIAEAQRKAESGDLIGARGILSNGRSALVATPSGQAGDNLCKWLEAELKETEERMSNVSLYEQSGRAFALAGISSHVSQRATTRGNTVPGADLFGSPQAANAFGSSATPAAYSTPFMQQMVHKSQKLNNTTQDSSSTSSTTPIKE